MAITQETQEYEILIRHNPDGRIGAHRQTITRIKDGDVVLTEILNSPVELNYEQVQGIVAELASAEWFVTGGGAE